MNALFACEQETDGGEGEEMGSRAALTAEDLAVLPETLILELRRAATQADDEAVHSVLAQIEGEHSDLAQTRSELVREFRFGDILALTDRGKRSADDEEQVRSLNV